MNQLKKSALAFCVAPLVPILVMSIVVEWQFYQWSLAGFLIWLVPVSVFAYIITLFVALPLYLVMLWFRWLDWWHFVVFSLLPGFSFHLYHWMQSFDIRNVQSIFSQRSFSQVVESITKLMSSSLPTEDVLAFFAPLSLSSMGAGLLFWFLAHRDHKIK